MKKFLAGLLLFGLIISYQPASAVPTYIRKAELLSGASLKAKSLTSTQKLAIQKSLANFPLAQKVDCIGLYKKGSKPSEVNRVRVLAKQACAEVSAKNKKIVTHIASDSALNAKEIGQVELVFRWLPAEAALKQYLETDPLTYAPNPNYVEGKACQGYYGWQVFGTDRLGNPAFLVCPRAPVGGFFEVDKNFFAIDPLTKMPLVPVEVPEKTRMAYPTNVYIKPIVDLSAPKSSLSPNAFGNYGQCKIASSPEDNSPDKSLGFPLPSPEISASLKPNFKILVVPVQFLDHRTKNRPAEDMADVVYGLSKFYERASSIPISFDWEIPDEYFLIERTIDSFNLDVKFAVGNNGSFWSVYKPYIQAVIDRVDSQFDFSKYDAVIIEEPRTVTDKEQGLFIPNVQESPLSSEGKVKRIMITGNDHLRDVQNWIHEFGHLLGLSDRNWNTNTTMSFDLLFGWYGVPELSVWNRWLLGVLRDQQIDCKVDQAASTHLLQPVAWVGDFKKGVVVPISDHEVLVAESRRRQGYDVMLGKESEGVIVYRVDTRAKIYQPSAQKPIDIVAPVGSTVLQGQWSFDVALQPGESIMSDGWKISVVESGTFGDVIKVERAN